MSKVFSIIFSVLILGGLIALTIYEIVGLVRTIKEKKKAKSIEKKEKE